MTSIQQAIKAVIPHTSKDKGFPILGTVALYERYAIACDRFTVARAQWDEGDPQTLSATATRPFLLSVAGAKEVAKMRHVYSMQIAEDDNGTRTLEIARDGGAYTFRDETGLTGGEYPNVWKFLEPFESWDWSVKREFDNHPTLNLDPAHLAKLSPSALKRDKNDARTPIRFMVNTSDPGKAIGFSYADYVIGALMPVRTPD